MMSLCLVQKPGFFPSSMQFIQSGVAAKRRNRKGLANFKLRLLLQVTWRGRDAGNSVQHSVVTPWEKKIHVEGQFSMAFLLVSLAANHPPEERAISRNWQSRCASCIRNATGTRLGTRLHVEAG
jgi:hypothetical protein